MIYFFYEMEYNSKKPRPSRGGVPSLKRTER